MVSIPAFWRRFYPWSLHGEFHLKNDGALAIGTDDEDAK